MPGWEKPRKDQEILDRGHPMKRDILSTYYSDGRIGNEGQNGETFHICDGGEPPISSYEISNLKNTPLAHAAFAIFSVKI